MAPLKFIKPAMMKSFTKWHSLKVHEDVDDVIIHCSAQPALYVRVEESQWNKIKKVKIALDDDNVRIPRPGHKIVDGHFIDADDDD